ncbi:MAG TPA: retron St85 family effector protein [Candidatus Sulfopaludibacter sp.]|jgi:hypothetical protein|nr:retron St85 family effector protein [Candidatus Sulfopaludibacter sp.]
MADSLLAFVQSIKVSTCRVRNTPNLIFLCGGPPQNPKAPKKYRSVRDYFIRYVKANKPKIVPRLRLAEDIGRWMDHERFTDLLEVENYLADLAETIILFVESPGSIAELGAFSALVTVQPKVLAVVNKKYDGPSFIADGPVRHLREHGSAVYKYSWNPATLRLNDHSNLDVFRDLSEELCEVLQCREDDHVKEPTLDLKSHGHAMLMVADLIDIVFATTMTDIQECLRALGRDVDKSTLQKYLFLLEDLKLIKEEYLNGPFYVTGGGGPYIAYDYNPGAEVKNRERAKILIRETLDEKRARILKRYQRQANQHVGTGGADHV